MAAEEKDVAPLERPSSTFDSLFERNLNHVLEMIFFPLDNASFKNCLEVCQKWRGLLTSEEFQRRRSRSAFSQRLWMDTTNLKHQLWYTDRAVPPWTTNGDQVAFIDGKTLKYITNEGQVKVVPLPLLHLGEFELSGLSNPEDCIWILKDTILILHEDTTLPSFLYFINKETLEASTFSLPTYDSSVASMDYYFVPQKGLVLRILVENESKDDCCIWLGKISMDHRQESVWQGNYEQDSYLFDEDRCSYFAKVESFFPPSYFLNGDYDPWHYFSEARYSFSEDGSHLMIVGTEENGYICLIALDGENTKLVWRKESKGETLAMGIPDNAYARANSRFVFLVHRRGRLTIKDIKDGSNIKDIELLPHKNQGSCKEEIFVPPSDSSDTSPLSCISEQFLIILSQKYYGDCIEERELLMVDLDTFETRSQPLNWFERDFLPEPEDDPSLSGFRPNLDLFHERELAVLTPNFITEDVNVHYHFDLTARDPFISDVFKTLCIFDIIYQDLAQIYMKQPSLSMAPAPC